MLRRFDLRIYCGGWRHPKGWVFMSDIRNRIKEKGRSVLAGNWLKAGVVLLIIGSLEIGISLLQSAYEDALHLPDDLYPFTGAVAVSLAVSLVFQVISFVFTTPLKLGQTEWYFRLTGRQSVGIDSVFAWFGSIRLFIKSLLLSLNIWLRMLLWFIFLQLFPSALVYCSYLAANKSKSSEAVLMTASSLMFLGLILLLAGSLLYYFIYTRYFLAPYLLVKDNSRRINDCVRESLKLTHGHRSEIFTFWLSFLGWFFLCVFIFPILFVLPYFFSSSAVFAKYLIFQNQPDFSADTMEFNSEDHREEPPV